MRLSMTGIAAEDVGDVYAQAAFRATVAEWEPRERTLRLFYSWSQRARGFAAVVNADPGEGVIAETFRHRTAIDAAEAAHAILERIHQPAVYTGGAPARPSVVEGPEAGVGDPAVGPDAPESVPAQLRGAA